MKKRLKNKLRLKNKQKSNFVPTIEDIQTAQHNISEAIKARDILADVLKENPDPEGERLLTDLEHSIALEIAKSKSEVSMAIRADFGNLVNDLHNTIEEFDDEQFLRLGEESLPFENVGKLVKLRDDLFRVKHKIPAQDDPDAIIADFDKAIADARQKLVAKRRKAEETFPELAQAIKTEEETQKLYKTVFPDHIDLRKKLNATIDKRHRTPLTADGSEYEMPDDHKEACRKWELVIEFRDKLLEGIESIPPEKRNEEGLAKLHEEIEGLNQWIINTEKLLQKEKEAHQVTRRAQDKAEKVVNDYELLLQDAVAQNPYILLGGNKSKP